MVSPDIGEYGLHPVAIISVPIPLIVFASIAISLRLWVRCFLVPNFGKDDIFLILAHVCFLAACADFMAIGTTELHHGLSQIVTLAVESILGIVLYLLNQIFFKISLAFFFLRIAHTRWHRMIIISSVVVVVIFNFALIIISITQCGPISSINPNNLSCLGWNILGPLNYFVATLNAVVDWIFALISILVVRQLRLTTRDLLSVYAIILLASAGSVVSIVRIPYISALQIDVSYYSSNNDSIAYASLIEAAIGIIATSLSVMRPLGTRLLQKARTVLSSGPDDSPGNTPQDRRETEQANEKPQAVQLFQALPTAMDTYAPSTHFRSTDVEKGLGGFDSRANRDDRPDP